ncbi:1098_t:CDS:2, partial [Racocetra fulgida]
VEFLPNFSHIEYILVAHIMNPIQTKESGEDSISLRNEHVQFFFENNLAEKELSSISSPYKSEIIEVSDKDSSDGENEKSALKIYHINGNMSKSTSIITLTTVINSHNHLMPPAPSITISNYHKLGEDMLEFIDLCVIHAIDNYNHTRLVATALLEDETEESFTWALNIINKCTGNLSPWSLKSNYTVAAGYIKCQLEPSKMKWPICYINNQFTTEVNSTQRVESFNRKIHDSIRANSSLMTLIKKIQDLLNQESQYTSVEEYKRQIPIVGLATIPKTFFNSLNSIVNEYLTELASIHVHKQMQECFFYDAYKLNLSDWNTIEKKVIDVAINSNSYDKLIGLCQQFLTRKQLVLNKDNQSENIPITNPIVSARRRRPPDRVKSSVEVQDSNAKKHRGLSNTNTNIQPPDNR